MSKWSECLTRRCRGAEELDTILNNADVIWEDSTIESSGHAFVVGLIDKDYFYARWRYDTYHKLSDISPKCIIFKNVSETKVWLKELRDSGYDKSQELLNVMRFFLT